MISNELKAFLYEQGAALAGFADLSKISDLALPFGVSVAIAIPAQVVQGIHEGPTMAYFEEYHRLNRQLNMLVTAGARFLQDRGYEALAQTTETVKEFGVYRTALPHKTVATRAGLGWIGKSALLVTEAYGSALRLSSLITNAPLECGTPITVSRCGSCMVCVHACPAHALTGVNWSPEVDRDDLFDPLICRKKARELTKSRTDQEESLCGKCFEICPYTQKYLKSISS